MNVEMVTDSHRAGPGRSLAAGIVFVVMLLAALSIWTAIPLSWIYIGSKVSHTQFPSTGPYFVVAAGIVASVLIIAWLIGRLNRLYILITGTNRLAPMRPARESNRPATFLNAFALYPLCRIRPPAARGNFGGDRSEP
jgi:hypothetical protein